MRQKPKPRWLTMPPPIISTIRSVRFGTALAGERVLDVCSGSGGSALPAAVRVGADGTVVAADLAGRLIDLARTKAEDLRLTNIAFRVDDMLALGYPYRSFDALATKD